MKVLLALFLWVGGFIILLKSVENGAISELAIFSLKDYAITAALAMPGMEERECLMRSSGERESELFSIKINIQDVKLGHRENQIENKNRKES